ncbi:MAG: hypothetical protein KGS45_05125 [Planctomycetes bacterium]|nr:hypothetical protein [Planctomycetota bacterium]
MNTASLHITAALIALTALSASSLAIPLYSNRSADPSTPALATGFNSLSGIAAPSGKIWSESASNNTNTVGLGLVGIAAHHTGEVSGSFRLADDFTVPSGAGWYVNTITVYAYQTGYIGGQSPFSAVNLRIWNGIPGQVGSSVVFGDTTTNRLLESSATNILRIGNSVVAPFPMTPDATRTIWASKLSINALLPAGTYWLDWQYDCVDPSKPALTPPVTIAGSVVTANANARQFAPSTLVATGAWTVISDAGKPEASADQLIDLPFLIAGSNGCPADYNADTVTDFFDYLDFVSAFAASDPAADFNADTVVDFFDYLDFVAAFAAGC